MFGVVPQDLPNLANRSIDAVVGIEEDPFTPDPVDYLLAGYKLSMLRHQQQEQFHGNALQLQRSTVAAQLEGPGIEIEILTESDSRWICCHEDTPEGGKDQKRRVDHSTNIGRQNMNLF